MCKRNVQTGCTGYVHIAALRMMENDGCFLQFIKLSPVDVMRLRLGAWWPEGRSSSSVSQFLPSCSWSACQMAAEWKDGYRGDLSPWLFLQLCFCSVWGRCLAYAKNNSNSNTVCNTDVVLWHDNILPSRLRYIIICNLVRQHQKHRKLECAALFRAAVSATFKTQRGAYTSTILCFSAWLALRNDTSLFLQRQSACFLQKRLTCLHFTWCENVKKLR